MCTIYSNIIKCIIDASHLIFLLNACLCGACSILSVAILLDLDSFAVFPSSSWSYVREIHVCVVRTRVQDACKILEDISSYSCMYIVHTHMCACKARAFSSSCFLIFAQMMFSHLRAVALGFIDLVCRQHRKIIRSCQASKKLISLRRYNSPFLGTYRSGIFIAFWWQDTRYPSPSGVGYSIRIDLELLLVILVPDRTSYRTVRTCTVVATFVRARYVYVRTQRVA